MLWCWASAKQGCLGERGERKEGEGGMSYGKLEEKQRREREESLATSKLRVFGRE